LRGQPGSRAFLAAIAATLLLAVALGRYLVVGDGIWLPVALGCGIVSLGVLVLASAADRDLLQQNVASLDRTNRELIEARAEVVRSARLASVGTLAAGIAHEVGNPLGAIIAYTDLARSRARRGELDPEILDSIRSEAERIDRIVRGLLDYARPSDEGVGPEPAGPVLDRVRDLLEAQGKLLGIDARWELDPDTPEVAMNPHRLEQVVVNLVLNALDAMEGSEVRTLHVRAYGDRGELEDLPYRRAGDPPGINYMHRRRISRDEGGRGVDPLFVAERVVVIEVVDNGPGIREDDLDQLFDPFFTTKEVGRGTGLGLSICARLVEGMGGRIEAGNAPEGGARFVVRLPAVRHTNPEGRWEAS
jgi:signal transduction histidine kinase